MSPTILSDVILRCLTIAAGISLVVFTLNSAVRTFVLPRGENTWLTRRIFRAMLIVFTIGFHSKTYEQRDRRLAMFAPVTLLVMPVVWIFLVMFGYAMIYWALDVRPFSDALTLSGSSLLTLGTVPFINFPLTLIEFTEATIGLGLTALLISYLPAMYSAFSQREAIVTMLDVRAGNPPSVTTFISRLHSIRGLTNLRDMWATYEQWFVYIDETHTSLGPLTFFRSPKAGRSWVTAAGALLDTASFITSTVDIPREPQAELCIRAGYIALRDIASFFRIQHNLDPHFPTDPISISQDEFDEVYDELAAAGVPLKPDREQAWNDFAGWRVNYDAVLIRLAALTMAPYAPWSSDRSQPLIRRRGRIY
jgi:hypothetical protein